MYAGRMCACVWFLAIWVARVPMIRAEEEDTSSHRDHLADVLRAGRHRSSRALLQQQGATLELAPEAISAGYSHTCALATNGSAFCWGRNDDGRLGDGTTAAIKSTPTLVRGGTAWTQISAGSYHTCALATSGSAFCWGGNDGGQLGDGTSVAKSTPTSVGGGTAWTQISAGSFHTCALATSSVAFCWGKNDDGRLGDGTAAAKSTPTPVTGSTAWTQISAGEWHTCALATNGSAFCWGYNGNGQLGDGTSVAKSMPNPVGDGTAWTQISAGNYHTCALATSGSAFCWGRNDDGRLGNGSTTAIKSTPTLVGGGTAWTQISAGNSHTCALATNGSAFCWGYNGNGQLGDGTIVAKSTPTPVGGGTAWTQISAGSYHTCALATNGSAFCWGWNDNGRLGDGTSVAKSTPTPVVKNGAFMVSVPLSPTLSPSPSVSPAVIAGGVAGGVVACVLVAAAAWLVARRRTKQRAQEKPKTSTSPLPATRPEDSLVLTLPAASPVVAPTSVDRTASDPHGPTTSDPVLRWIDSHAGDMATGNGESLRETHSPQSSQRSEPPARRPGPALEVPTHVRDLEFAWNEVRIVEALGWGSFGKVFLAKVRHAPVAVKLLLDAKTVASASAAAAIASQTGTRLQEPEIAVASCAALVGEVAAMAPLRHANVVQLLGFCTEPPALTTEYCSRGSVFDLLQKGRRDQEIALQLSWGLRVRMAADAAAGMLHLHTRSPPIVHRDLKTPNLLVAGDWVVKVADMGLSKLVEDVINVKTRGAAATAGGGGATNPRWLSPEALRGERSTAASDVFSFGVVMWELLTWRVPWDDANPAAIPFAVLRGDRLAVPEMAALPGFSSEERRTHASSVASYVSLMRRCWAADPAARPMFSDIAAELRAASD